MTPLARDVVGPVNVPPSLGNLAGSGESSATCCPSGKTPAAAVTRHSGGSTAPQRGQPPGCSPTTAMMSWQLMAYWSGMSSQV